MAIGKDIIALQGVLGYSFTDISYLELALTHSSYTNEQRARGINTSSNERLEFLGDAVLELVISEYLYSNFKKYREGALTKMRQSLVCEKTLSKIAAEISLGEYLNLGHGEENSDCRSRPKILADALEAVFGAIYLDAAKLGAERCRGVILALYAKELSGLSSAHTTDYKTKLQQLTEQDGTAVLEYKIVEQSGPDHDKTFTVAAFVNNNEVGRGSASNKKDAEMLAAKEALALFGALI